MIGSCYLNMKGLNIGLRKNDWDLFLNMKELDMMKEMNMKEWKDEF